MEHEEAITDLINFIAEFELWLEKERQELQAKNRLGNSYFNGAYNEIDQVLYKYRECKKRIQYGGKD